MSSRYLLIAVSGMALAGCNTMYSHIGDEDPMLGESVRYNAAVQTINPDPVYAEGGMLPGGMGAKGAAAVNRYRTDKVNDRHTKEVNSAKASTLSTTQGVGQGSGGGGPR